MSIASGKEPLVVIFASEKETEGFASFGRLHTAPIGDEFGKSVVRCVTEMFALDVR